MLLSTPSVVGPHYGGPAARTSTALCRFPPLRKPASSASGEIVRIWLLVHYASEWTLEALKWLAGHKRPLRRARLEAYGEVLRSRLRA